LFSILFLPKKQKKTFFFSHSGGYVRLYLYDKNPSGKIGWAIGQLAYNSAPDHFIGLSATFPLGNEAAKARLRRARLVTLEQTMYRGIDEIINIISGLSLPKIPSFFVYKDLCTITRSR